MSSVLPVLRLGSSGEYVVRWTTFLHGEDPNVLIGPDFNDLVEDATIAFQASHNLKDDGIVGEATWGKAMAHGLRFDVRLHVENFSEVSPDGIAYIPNANKPIFFGELLYKVKSTAGDITIVNNWEKNVTRVFIPQLKTLAGIFPGCGFPANGKVDWHSKYADNLLKFFADIDAAGLLGHVKTWAGSWSPRLVRGGTTLSSHAYATAFDINAAWNGLGRVPAKKGTTGSVVELVEIAKKNTFWWGGWGWGPNSRLDGMHFEIGRHDIIRE